MNPSFHVRRELRENGARAGSVLVPALMVVLAIGVLSAVWLRLSIDKHKEIRASADAKRAFYLAEAGLAESYLGLVAGKSGNVGSDALPAAFADGVFWVTTEDGGSGKVVLRSTGLCGTGRAALSLVVEKVVESVASLGVFGQEGVEVQAGCRIDSYDSRAGPYSPVSAGRKARVGCNEGIDVRSSRKNQTRIHGDVTPGPDETVVVQAGAEITGSTAPREEPVPLPPLEPPAFPRETSVVHTDPKKPLTLPTGEYGLTELRVGTKAQATLRGPATVVVDELWVAKNGSLVLDGTSGDVQLYVLDHASLKSGSNLSTKSQTPRAVSLLIGAGTAADYDGDGKTDPPVALGASGAFHGTIYAPNAELNLPEGLEVFGAVAGRSIVLRGSARVHFDEALVDLDAAQEARPRFSCWRIVELPDVPLVDQRFDPLAALARAGIEPVPAKDAHYDIGVVPPSDDPNRVPFTGGLPGLNPSNNEEGEANDGTEPVSPAGAALIAQIDQIPALKSSDLKSILKDASPLEDAVLRSAIGRSPAMKESHLRDVLEQNSPLSPAVLEHLLGSPALDHSKLRDVLEASSPLPGNILDLLPTLVPARLTAGELLDVLLGG